jgi:hypothetical protein
MKVIILLFFVLVTPFFVFLMTLFYGGISSETLKDSLSKSDIYSNISQFITESSKSDDKELKQLTSFISDRFTPGYIQQKAELAVDDSYDWITGTSNIAPVVSFSELKDDLINKNPKLLKEIESMSAELKETTPDVETVAAQEDAETSEELTAESQFADVASSFASIVNQDFSIKIEPYLAGVKGFYSFSKILLPITLIIMIGSLVLLAFINPDWKSRFKWIGSTLMISGVVGFGLVVFNNLAINVVTGFANSDEKGIMGIFGPVFIQVIKSVLEANNNFQLITGIILLIMAAGFFVGASLSKEQKALVQPATKSSKKK